MEYKGTLPDSVSVQELEPLDSSEVAEELLLRRRTQRRRITIFVVVSIVNVALLALLWTQLLTPAQGLPTSDNNATIALGDVSSPLVSKPAPNFTLPLLNENGAKLNLADLKGKPVILNFWDSACGPCNDEAPFLQKTAMRLQGQGVVFLGINSLDRTSEALKFLQKYDITYQNVQDTTDGATGIDYGVTGHPETIFINREGVVVAKWIAPLTDKGLELEMAKMMR